MYGNGNALEINAAAIKLGLDLITYPVDTEEGLRHAMADAVRQGASAVYIASSFAASAGGQRIVHDVAQHHRIPVMHRYLDAARSGGLMFYGIDSAELYRRTASFVHRILKGGDPATMPIEQPSAYRLILNKKAARAIGMTFPAALLVEADEIIE